MVNFWLPELLIMYPWLLSRRVSSRLLSSHTGKTRCGVFLEFLCQFENEDGLLKAGTKLADAQVSLPFYQPFVAEVQSSSVVADDAASLLTLTAGNLSVGLIRKPVP